MSFIELTPNQRRVTIDSRQTFEAWRQARLALAPYAGGMTWKTVKGHEYLIRIINRQGGTKSLGRRSPESEKIFQDFTQRKAQLKARLESLRQSQTEFAGMARGVGVNRVPNVVAGTLRLLDEHGLLGKNLMVIGTNALYGYEASAGVQFDPGLMGTTDVDFLWDSRASLNLGVSGSDIAEGGLLAILRKVDSSFEPARTQSFRAVNKEGFYVDLVKQTPHPPWKPGEPERMAAGDLTPSWLPNIQWLLASEKFESIVIGQDGYPAPMVAPDPRAFATYKHWLSQQADRDPLKAERDRLQAAATMELVREKYPHLKLDENAERMFPKSIRQLPQS